MKIQKNLLLSCLVCIAFSVNIPFSYSADETFDVSQSSYRPTSLNGANDTLIENSHYYSSSHTPIPSAGIVVSANRSRFELENVIIENILSTQNGSVIDAYENSFLVQINKTVFRNNGIKITGDPGSTLLLEGGAIRMQQLEEGRETELYVKADIGDIIDSSFLKNSIVAETSGDFATIFARGAAVYTNNIGYIEYAGQKEMIDENDPDASYSTLTGGIFSSKFEKNLIDAKVNNSTNGTINASGSAVFAKYIKNIKDSQFNNNSINANLAAGESASGTISGGTIQANGISQIENSEFVGNSVSQNTRSDTVYNAVLGGVLLTDIYSINKISDSKFNSNSVKSFANGRSSADAYVRGGILSSYSDIANISNSSFSGNSLNISATSSNSTANVEGGIINSNSIRNISDSKFNSNIVNISSDKTLDVKGAVLYSYASALSGPSGISALSTDKISKSSFDSNSIKIYSLGNDTTTSLMGGENFSAGEINTISDSSISKNNLELNATGNNSSIALFGGGAVASSIKNISNSNFNENNLTVNAGSNADITLYGGSLMSVGDTLLVSDSSFEKNNITVNAGATPQEIDVQGGALYLNETNIISGTNFKNNTISVNGNNAQVKAAALYLGGANIKNINNSVFDGNKITLQGEGSTGHGGAIYNAGGKLNITDTSFTKNSASHGGAIYSLNDVSIVSDQKNIKFAGNTATSGGDIYLENSNLNIDAKTADRTISFDGGISLNDVAGSSSNHQITTKGSGTVILNAPITYQGSSYATLNIQENAKVKVGNDSNISNSKLKISLNDNSSLDLINNQATKIDLYDFETTSNAAGVALDLNLDGTQSDYLELHSASPSTTAINIKDINILSDANVKDQTIKVSSGNGVVNANYTIFTNENKYNITQDTAETNKLHVRKDNDAAIDGFAQAAVNASDSKFSAMKDIVTDLSGSNKVNNNLNVNGQNYALDFSGKTNLEIAETKTLNLNNISQIRNSGDTELTVDQNANLNINSSTTDTAILTPVKLKNNTSIVNVNLSNNHSAIFNNKISGDNASKGIIKVDSGKIGLAELENINLVADNSTVNLNSKINSSDLNVTNSNVNLYSEAEEVVLNANNSVVNVNNSLSGRTRAATPNTLNINNSKMYVANESDINGIDLSLDTSYLSTKNGDIGTVNLKSLSLTGKNDVAIDVDLADLKADKINAETVNVQPDASLNISEFNIVKNTIATGGTVSISDTPEIRQNTTTSVRNVDNGIYSYQVSRTSDGNYNFFATRYDPAILTGPMAQQAQFATQINSYNQAFSNMDMIMLKPYAQRMVGKYAGKVAINDDDRVRAYLGHERNYHSTDYSQGPWFRPYGSIENIRFHNGPKVYNYMYGSTIGYDSSVLHLKGGVDSVISGYVAYNGSNQKYESAKINQNGATAGITSTFYKNNFFTGLTLNSGVSIADATNSHGQEDFTMLSAGGALKTGYNLESDGGMFIFQPSLLASYTFINNPDYTNSTGLRIKSDPLNAVQLEPGIKFIFNIGDSLQTYLGASAVFTMMGKSDFRVYNAGLPRLSYEPYGYYRLGMQKRWGERSSGFAQTAFRSGGRNGAELQFGMRFAI